MNEPKSCLIERINKVDKPLGRLIKNTYYQYKKWKKKHITDHTDIKEYYEWLNSKKFDNLDEWTNSIQDKQLKLIQ